MSERRSSEPAAGPVANLLKREAGHRGQNSGVPLSRISWIVTVGACLLAGVLLLINGYSGYAAVSAAVAAAAAVNLL